MFAQNIRQINFRWPFFRGGQFVLVQLAEYCSTLSVRSLTVLRTGKGNVTTTVLSNGSTVRSGQGQAFKCVSKPFDILMAFASVKMVCCKH